MSIHRLVALLALTAKTHAHRNPMGSSSVFIQSIIAFDSNVAGCFMVLSLGYVGWQRKSGGRRRQRCDAEVR